MRYSKVQTIIVSEDDSSLPKQCRFGETDQNTTDVTLLKEVVTSGIDLPTTTTFALPLGAIGTGKWFYLFCDKEFTLQLNAGPAITLAKDKPHEMWAEFTAIEVTTTDASRLTYALGGE